MAKIIADSKRIKSSKTHPATKTFQALRIWINDEMACLEKAFNTIADLGKSGCRIVCISFHSLEDRLVKRNFKDFSKNGLLKILTKKPIMASDEEVNANRRSKSAKLRCAQKI